MDKTLHPQRWLAVLAIATATASTGTALAQKYPQTEDGATIYYKLLSACPEYAGSALCLQDDSRTNKTYAYTLAAEAKDTRSQEWVLVTADKAKETYHLRNRASYRYLSTESSWAGNFKVLGFATRQIASNALTFTSLGDDQVAISYQDEDGTRYLSATDVDREQPDITSDLRDTQWAWKIYRASDLASGIQEACAPGVQIWVEGQHIRVSGADAWELTDVSGMLLPHDHPVLTGHIYMVKAKGTTHKIIVR